MVSLRELFPALEIDETLDLSAAPITIASGITEHYDVTRVGNAFELTPRVTTFDLASLARRDAPLFLAAPEATSPIALSPFPPFTDCQATVPGLTPGAPPPVALSVPPVFGFSMNLSLDVVSTPANGLEHWILKSSGTFKIESAFTFKAALSGKVECRLELAQLTIPVGGVLSLLVSGVVPIGVGVEVGGDITVSTLGLGVKSEMQANVDLGIACRPGGDCTFQRAIDPKVTVTPTLDVPSLGDLRIEPAAAASVSLEAQIGNPFLSSLRFSALKASVGGRLSGSFAPFRSQIDDASYKSSYKVTLEAAAKLGAKVDEAARALGLASVTPLELKLTSTLGASPTAVPTGAVTTDWSTFAAGEKMVFTVQLDPSSVQFVPGLGPYNVDGVFLVRREGVLGATVVGNAPVAAGQSTFQIPFTAPDAGSVSDFFAFVRTALLPYDLLSLEVEGATGTARPDGGMDAPTDARPDGAPDGQAVTCPPLMPNLCQGQCYPISCPNGGVRDPMTCACNCRTRETLCPDANSEGGQRCRDIGNDPFNCGTCGHVCPSTPPPAICLNGACQ